MLVDKSDSNQSQRQYNNVGREQTKARKCFCLYIDCGTYTNFVGSQ